MINLKNILLFSFLLFGLNSFAQTDTVQYGKLEVKVIDAKTKKPLEFASISIQINDKKLNKYSDKDGICKINFIPFGKHTINISLSGYCRAKQIEIVFSKDSNTIFKVFELVDSIQGTFIVTNLHCFGPSNANLVFGTLAGKIIDSKSKKQIEYAVITIVKDSFKKSKYSDKEGAFVFTNIPIGNYNTYISYTGWQKIKIENMNVLKDSIIYRIFEMIYTGKSTCMHCDLKLPQNVFIKPDEPTQQYYNNKKIMRMPY